jgi:hypothetical protein
LIARERHKIRGRKFLAPKESIVILHDNERWEYRHVCDRPGKGGKQIERCVIATFQIAQSLGFNGEFRQWEHLLRVGG